MARSKKDGRQGAGHRALRKWKRLSHRRREQNSRRVHKEVIEEEISSIEQDLYQDYLDQCAELSGADFDWHEDYLDWQDQALYDQWSEADAEYGQDYDYRDDPHHFWDDPPWDPEPRFDVFTAVDRAVRRQGIQAVMNQAHLLAAAFDVSSYEIIRCANLTKAGYIRYA